jgi:tRNA A-37 threonylcarbamoyl transferase component Bud32
MNANIIRQYKHEMLNLEREKVVIHLEKVYKHLQKNCKNEEGITKNAFMDYLELSNILNERLFIIFNKSKDKIMKRHEFIEGLINFYFPQEDLLADVIFDILDFGGKGLISFQDTIFILSFITSNQSNSELEKVVRNCFVSKEHITREHFYYNNKDIIYLMYSYIHDNIPHLGHIPVYYFKSKHLPQFVFKTKEEDFTKREKILQKVPTDTGINIAKNLKKKKTISLFGKQEEDNAEDSDSELKFMEESISLEIPSLDVKSKAFSDDIITISKSNTEETVSRFHSNDVWKLKNYFDVEFVSNHEGYVYKITEEEELKKCYLRLNQKDLFIFKGNECRDKISKTINLTNAFVENGIEKIVNNVKVFSFQINLGHRKIHFFLRSIKEKDDWIKHISNSIGFKFVSNEYTIKENIGHGYFSIVKLAENKITQQKIAIKIMKKKNLSDRSKEYIREEAEILKLCDHPNIIKLVDSCEDKEHIFIMLEYIDGGSLRKYYTNHTERFHNETFVIKILKNIAEGIGYLHRQGIMHRDIKPENILISDKDSFVIKIIDFGLSKIIPHSQKTNLLVGTLNYSAPEVLKKKTYNNKVDIWSFGILAFYLLCGSFPFETNGHQVLFTEEIPFTDMIWKKRSSGIKKIIKKCLLLDYEKRINAEELLKLLKGL